MRVLDDLIHKLPPEDQNEVIEFVQALLRKRKINSGKKLSLKWAGALKDYRDQYTSVELQKKSLDWRNN
jgi:hypothetical protein